VNKQINKGTFTSARRDKNPETIFDMTWNPYTSKNPIVKLLVYDYTRALKQAIKLMPKSRRVYDLGCGRGCGTRLLSNLLPRTYIHAYDRSFKVLSNAADCRIIYWHSSIYNLHYIEDNNAKAIFCNGVLEHLHSPRIALREIQRILHPDGYVEFSVPREPLFRLMNVCRGKHLKRIGATPGHQNFWSKRAFCKLIETHFEIVKILTPLPHTMVIAKQKKA